METVPRDLFAPRRYGDLARQDVALPLPCGESMTAPTTVAAMLAALGARPGHRVFEVGTGSGYITALLACLGCTVTSWERRPLLAESARHRLAAAGYGETCRVLCEDGFGPMDPDARFDRILLNGLVPGVPPEMTSRLGIGGRLVAGVAGEGGSRLLIVTRDPEGQLAARYGVPARLSRLMVNEVGSAETEA